MVNVINLKSLKSCGGAIISSNTIITGENDSISHLMNETPLPIAAHCIIDKAEYNSVIAGAAYLFGRLNVFNYYAVCQVIIHPNYISYCDYDAAIIKLKKTLESWEIISASIDVPNNGRQLLFIDFPFPFPLIFLILVGHLSYEMVDVVFDISFFLSLLSNLFSCFPRYGCFSLCTHTFLCFHFSRFSPL